LYQGGFVGFELAVVHLTLLNSTPIVACRGGQLKEKKFKTFTITLLREKSQ